uniref:Uncharacterized protein n=1 Tax=Ascaris lumbricoides TaxID=6252 RepID=A0A0M3I708_ASCLU
MCLNTEVSTVAVNALVVSPETWQYNRRQACDISRNYSRTQVEAGSEKRAGCGRTKDKLGYLFFSFGMWRFVFLLGKRIDGRYPCRHVIS